MSACIEDTYERAVVELLEGICWENVAANGIKCEFDAAWKECSNNA